MLIGASWTDSRQRCSQPPRTLSGSQMSEVSSHLLITTPSFPSVLNTKRAWNLYQLEMASPPYSQFVASAIKPTFPPTNRHLSSFGFCAESSWIAVDPCHVIVTEHQGFGPNLIVYHTENQSPRQWASPGGRGGGGTTFFYGWHLPERWEPNLKSISPFRQKLGVYTMEKEKREVGKWSWLTSGRWSDKGSSISL